MAPIDASVLADEDIYGDYRVGDWVRIADQKGTVWHIMSFRRCPDRADEVTVYGGVRRKDEWISASVHTFCCHRIARLLKTRLTPTGGVVVSR